ncbi:isochorismate synthase [Reichenbachiella faecimaris]|uniref:Isochorismate synthase n=1 Tax=Reichenbachiella faecimaris TaxID=692418 RepID=A0A1W2GRE9_REIFA|nr:chorismate-binding protein [Reichenbachiella faecimaris]SMD39134.1 isochorismate synthase [Reichenbachiella faecimaris]
MELSKQTTHPIPDTVFLEKLENFFSTGIKMDLPFAIWRNPRETIIHSTLQLDQESEVPDEIENAPTGFMVSPFEASERHESQFIKSDVLLDSDLNEILLAPGFNDKEGRYENFLKQYAIVNEDKRFDYKDFLEAPTPFKSTKDSYLTLVQKCKESISEGYYQKIVPSRREKFRTEKNFHPVKELIKLCEAYENAFVSLVYLPSQGLWLGATPELLISVDEAYNFETISLAGTQEIRPGFELAQVSWTQKEIEEQALVSRYIVNCFKKIRLREFDEYGPKTVKAGNLIHLKTTFKVNMQEVNFPQLGSVMLDLLHPTSAVCGMPMIPAAKFLQENEAYDREYYSGYLGPVKYDGQTALYVNLRCAKIYKNDMILFAGAGVTEDSDPEKEWVETEIKFQTLLNVIQAQ